MRGMRASDPDQGKQETSRKQLEHAVIILGDKLLIALKRLPPLWSLVASLRYMYGANRI